MCVEVYAPNAPLTIPYEQESIDFVDGVFRAKYLLLVRNDGLLPLNRLLFVYPRSLVDDIYPKSDSMPNGRFAVRWPRTITDDIPNRFTDATRSTPANGEQTLTLIQPDPNDPQFDRPPLAGVWKTAVPAKFERVAGLDLDCIHYLKFINFTCGQLNLNARPLLPNESRWFWWEIKVPEAGKPVGQILPGLELVLYQLASPVDVSRTLSEMISSAEQNYKKIGDQFRERVCSQITKTLQLNLRRKVDIQYYELTINPGRDFMFNWQMERDLRMRTHSPRNPIPSRGEGSEGLLYEWKSGSLLDPDHAWKDEGFVLHMTLGKRSS